MALPDYMDTSSSFNPFNAIFVLFQLNSKSNGRCSKITCGVEQSYLQQPVPISSKEAREVLIFIITIQWILIAL